MLIPGADHGQAEVTFSLFGVTRHMSMEELGVALGLYTREEVTQPIYTQAVHHMAADELRVFWRQISDTVMSPADTARPSSEIRDPLHRYVYFILYFIFYIIYINEPCLVYIYNIYINETSLVYIYILYV